MNFGTTIGDGQMSYSWSRDNATVVTGMDQTNTGDILATVLSNKSKKPQVTKFTVTPTYTNNGISCTGEAVEFTMTVNPEVIMNTPSDIFVRVQK